MGLPIGKSSMSDFFELILNVQSDYQNKLYYKRILSVLSSSYVQLLFDTEPLVSSIQENNIAYLTVEDVTSLSPESDLDIIKLLIGPWKDCLSGVETLLHIIKLIKNQLEKHKQAYKVELEYLFKFYQLFTDLKHHIKLSTDQDLTVKALKGLYNELIKMESVDFQGSPFNGLQIMGMLETRVLDFETVIISSVNEGILPAGKTNNSFIPFDVKKQYGLPTYKEKDAVYTYHFYRLLQRAKTVYILYDTEQDSLNGGEPSRFIKQIEVEGTHNLTKAIASPVNLSQPRQNKIIKKSEEIIDDLTVLAGKGFSPSSLTNYIRNPIDFYSEKLLGVRQFEEVEETLASNTLGNIIHKTLEALYTPYIRKPLSVSDVDLMCSKVDALILHFFEEEYKKGDFSKGKNLILFEVSKEIIIKFLSSEKKVLNAGNTIEIISLEEKVETVVNVSGLNKSVKIKGVVDRIDRFNGVTRIIDYKTGKVEQSKVEIINWDDILTDYTKHSKSFQILTYVYMLHKNGNLQLPCEAGIISFKNLNKGFLKFAQKDRASAYAKKEHLITTQTLSEFKVQLDTLILELFNPDIAFIEKEV